MSTLFSLPLQFLVQLTGLPYAGLQAYFYRTGTSEELSVYQDAELSTAHAQPVQADDNGFLPPIFLDPNATSDYRVVLRDRFGTLIPGGDIKRYPRRPSWLSPFTPTSVKDAPYGARGDGVAIDRAAIQAAIDAKAEAGGGWVYLPAGTYLVDGDIDMRSNVTLIGEGHRSCIKVADGASFVDNILKFEVISHAAVIDIRIDGNRANVSGGTQYGIYFGGATNCQMIRCRVHSMTGDGLHVYNSDGCLVESCVAWDNFFHGFEYEQTRDSIAVGNVFRNNLRNGIYVFQGEVGATGSKGITLIGNSCHNNGEYGIAVQGELTEDVTVVGNVIRNNGKYGATFFDRVRGAVFNGNIVTGNGFSGLYLYKIQEAVVQGNRFRNNSQALHAGHQEIHLDSDSSYRCKHNLIVGNSICIDGAVKAAYAIKENTTEDGPNLIFGNVLTGTGANGTIAPLHETGQNNSMQLCKFNIGSVRQARGNVDLSADGTQNVFSFAHGLAPDEPRFVAVTPYGAGAAGAYFVSSDATNITLTFTTAPPAGTVAVRYYAES